MSHDSDRWDANHLEENLSLASCSESFIARSANPSLIRRAIDRRGLKQLLAGTLACLLLAFGLVFHAWMRTQVTQEGYRLSKLTQEHQQLLRRREELTLLSARLRNPARIEALAREELQMSPPGSDRVVVLATNKMPVQKPAALAGTRAVARR